MDLGTALKAISVVSGVIGIAMLFIPGIALRPFGIRLDAAGAFGARLFGVANIALAVAIWDGQSGGPDAVQGLGNAVFYYSVLQGIVTTLAVIRRVANPWASSLVALDVAFIAAIWSQGWR
jgi:hypothetical protein